LPVGFSDWEEDVPATSCSDATETILYSFGGPGWTERFTFLPGEKNTERAVRKSTATILLGKSEKFAVAA
jgi:hypothetical protein